MSDKSHKDWKKFKDENQKHIDENEEHLTDNLNVDDAAKGALEHPSYLALEEKLTLIEQQAHDNWEKSVRAMAELDNVRRRAERDIANAHRYGLEKFVSALLPVLDGLEQALQLADKSGDAGMHEGIALTMKLFQDVFEKFDVQQLDPIGAVFDPHQHEAMATQVSMDVAPNTVLTVFQKGYKLGDRVIRPARVVVAKEKS